MRTLGAALAACIALAGCEFGASAEDTRVKAGLVGSWSYDYISSGVHLFHVVTEQRADGSFISRERIKGHPEVSVDEGEWYYTAGLLKQRTTRSGGQALGLRQTMYFTCKVAGLTADGFECSQVGRPALVFQRVGMSKPASSS